MAISAVMLRRLVERYVPPLLALVVATAVWSSATGAIGVRSPLPAGLVLLIAVACGSAAGVVRSRRWPLFLAAAVGWLVLAAGPVVAVASYQAGRRLRERRRLAGYLIGAALVMAGGVLVGMSVGGLRRLTTATPANAALLVAWLVVFPLLAGLLVRSRWDVLAALRDRAERLEREQLAHTERVRAEERARIAREMHDVVAHQVSLMVVHAGALEVTASDASTVEAAALIRSTGRQALTDLREVLGVLRQPGPPRSAASDAAGDPLQAVDELVRESQAAGLRVRRWDEGAARPLPPTVGRTVHRVVREALTNVRKHAPDAETTVCLRYLPDGVEVVVRNGSSRGARRCPVRGWGCSACASGSSCSAAGWRPVGSTAASWSGR
ncbi:histidine kinase [Micromonospora sp. NPDC094482]|uniref:sensor histidine kinase n=1 Tax=unclassified Micromonospora TaxID=2617518 RepID=UPI003324A9DA